MTLQADIVVWISISLNIALALLLMFFTHRGNSPYFVLLALPVLQAAYRFRLPTCISVIVVADSITFFWVWRFAKSQPPNYASEYLEAGVISARVCAHGVVGLAAWSISFEATKEGWPITSANWSARVSD